MKKNRKGCYSEKVAICYLMAKGLDVFDSCQTNGAVDLITFDPDTVKLNVGKLRLKTSDYLERRKATPFLEVAK